jgi:hypothetical protein
MNTTLTTITKNQGIYGSDLAMFTVNATTIEDYPFLFFEMIATTIEDYPFLFFELINCRHVYRG